MKKIDKKVAVEKPKKEKPILKKPEKVAKPAKPEKVTKPAKVPVTKGTGFNVRPGTKIEMAIKHIRKKPGTTSYDLKQQTWNDKNDPYRNALTKFVEQGLMRKEGRGYFINEGF